MEHAIHLCAGHFIADISPSSIGSIIKKMQKWRHEENLDGSEDNDEGKEDGFFDAGDAISKGLKRYADFRLSAEEWKSLDLIHKILQVAILFKLYYTYF